VFQDRAHISDLLNDFENRSEKVFVIVGRIVAKRNMTKAIFADIQDISGRIQVFISKENIDEKFTFKIGDFLHIKGSLRKTKTGEVTIFSDDSPKNISESENHLPDKTSDENVIINKRYLSILTDKELFNALQRRSKIITSLRNSLLQKGFMEVTTPILSKSTSVGSARPFITKSEYLNKDFYLRGTCEMFLKQLIVAGYEKVFEIGSVFRNESPSLIEFPLLEIEQAFSNVDDMTTLVENILKPLLLEFNIDRFNAPWKKISLRDLLKQHLEVDIFNLSKPELAEFAYKKDHNFNNEYDLNLNCALISNSILKNSIIKTLIEPTFVIGYPKSISPLAKSYDGDSIFSERGYLFIEGLRMCEVVSEQHNPSLQKKAFEEQNSVDIWGKQEHSNPDLLQALSYGCPPTGGVGLNINRLVALILNSRDLDRITFFPLTTTKFHS